MTSDIIAEFPAGVGTIVVQIPSIDSSDQGSFVQPFSAKTHKAPISSKTDKLVRDTNTFFLFVFMTFLLS
jgi:hypothetical protein